MDKFWSRIVVALFIPSFILAITACVLSHNYVSGQQPISGSRPTGSVSSLTTIPDFDALSDSSYTEDEYNGQRSDNGNAGQNDARIAGTPGDNWQDANVYYQDENSYAAIPEGFEPAILYGDNITSPEDELAANYFDYVGRDEFKDIPTQIELATYTDMSDYAVASANGAPLVPPSPPDVRFNSPLQSSPLPNLPLQNSASPNYSTNQNLPTNQNNSTNQNSSLQNNSRLNNNPNGVNPVNNYPANPVGGYAPAATPLPVPTLPTSGQGAGTPQSQYPPQYSQYPPRQDGSFSGDSTSGNAMPAHPLNAPMPTHLQPPQESQSIGGQDLPGAPIIDGNLNKSEMVVDVRAIGYGKIPLDKIRQKVKSRPNRLYNELQVEEDKRSLQQTGWFYDVRPEIYRGKDGIVITFVMIERPLLHYVKIVGNTSWNYSKKKLLEEAGIKPGDQLDTMVVTQAKLRLEEFYKSSGHHKVHIEILSGDRMTDRGAVFLISEGNKQKIDRVQFLGCNSDISGKRLKTQIKSKPGILYVFGGEFTRETLDQDVEKLTDYYRNLGYFFAKIDRDFLEGRGYLGFGKEDCWVTVRFIIDEGPRCKISKINIVGNNQYTDEEILKVMKKAKVRQGDPYNQMYLDGAMLKIKDLYGKQGRVFTEVTPDPVIDFGTVELNVVIRESVRAQFGEIDYDFYDTSGGKQPYTKINAVRNVVSSTVRPGKMIDTTEVRRAERRLKSTGLFNMNPARGYLPEVLFDIDEKDMDRVFEDQVSAKKDDVFRGQSGRSIPVQPYTTTSPASSNYSNSGSGSSNSGTATFGSVKTGTANDAANNHSGSAVNNGNTGSATSPDARSQVYSNPNPQYGSVVPYNQSGTASSGATGNVGSAGVSGSYTSGYPQPAPQPPVTSSGPFGSSTYNANAPITASAGTSTTGYTGNNSTQSVTTTSGGLFAPAPPFVPGAKNPSTHAGGIVDPVMPGSSDLDDFSSGMINTGPPGPIFYPGTLRVPAHIRVQETETGSLMASVGITSDSGVIARFTYDERNFNWRRPPRNPLRWEDWRKAFRGAGERFRIDAQPGTVVQRYEVSWETPSLMDTNWSLGLSGFFYTRNYNEWREQRAGGTVSLGYKLTPDLAFTTYYKGENVDINHPIMYGIPDLDRALGANAMHTFGARIAHDTRDNPQLATEGHLLSFTAEQIVGSYQYPRLGVDLRRYFMIRERPDTSGRWVLGLRHASSWTDIDTPIFERYYAGGFTSLRGFEFRGVSPRDATNGFVPIGGNFEMFNSAELIFPITADDMIRGVVFLDTGCVQPKIDDWAQKYRVSPGFGLRISVPFMGQAPIAFDFAFPVMKDPSDVTQVFSFYVGFMR
ncbi:MAG: BamA/TamA family outer membrane protein [Thermoguttaceae bacterium]